MPSYRRAWLSAAWGFELAAPYNAAVIMAAYVCYHWPRSWFMEGLLAMVVLVVVSVEDSNVVACSVRVCPLPIAGYLPVLHNERACCINI